MVGGGCLGVVGSVLGLFIVPVNCVQREKRAAANAQRCRIDNLKKARRRLEGRVAEQTAVLRSAKAEANDIT